MKEIGRELIEATNEMNDCFEVVVKKEMDIKHITPETLALMQAYIKFVEASNKYIEEVSEMMDNFDKKLDELLFKIEIRA